MAFPFALSRIILLTLLLMTNVVSIILSAIAFRTKTGGEFQVLAICFGVISSLAIVACLCHQEANQDEETSNTRNLGLFAFSALLGLALAILLTAHAHQDRGMGLCGDFANAAAPCIPAGIQLGTAYASPIFASIGFVISWIDKFPSAVKVTPRYPITKAPSSHFAAHAHDLDGDVTKYTPAPVKVASRLRNNAEWTNVPI